MTRGAAEALATGHESPVSGQPTLPGAMPVPVAGDVLMRHNRLMRSSPAGRHIRYAAGQSLRQAYHSLAK